MKSINLYSLTTISDIETFSLFWQKAGQMQEVKEVRPHEQVSLLKLVEELKGQNVCISDFEDFYFGYSIPQIGKEFDLLKFSQNEVLNIELKSEEVEFEKIKRQLTKNRYYLQYLNRNMRLFTFIAATGDVFALNESGELEYSDITTVSSAIKALTGNREIDVQGLFRVSNYLISPLNTPERFLCEQYFLTKQQEEFKNAIMSFFKRETPCFCAISGEAGTGKTLLLYDIVRECGKLGHCCVIHCGNLSQGHLYLNEKLLDVDIIAAKDLRNGYDFDIYEYVFVDEAQRIYQNSFELIVDAVQKGGKKCVWSYDSKQTLSLKEQNRNIQAKIELLSGIHKCYLTGKIRTNKEMAYFLRSLWDLNEARDEGQHPNVTVVYANTIKEVEEYLTYYAQKGYTFINFTPSLYQRGNFDQFDMEAHFSTHFVIGQEFDNVMMIMDNNFYYDENGILKTYTHPNPDYLYRQLLFQGLSRVREKLCIIVFGNQKLFKNILRLL